MLIIAAFSGEPAVISWARDNLQIRYGPIVLESQPFDFVETHYYDDTMGAGLKKQFFAFGRLISPELLGVIKLETNDLERQAAERRVGTQLGPSVKRPLNLDPGYLHAGKWVLA